MRWWTLSWRKTKVFLVVAAMLALLAGRLYAGAEPDISTLSYGIAGQVIVVDPGHGGIDSGAVGRQTKTPEKEITLAISKKLARALSQAGAMVVMTRETDTDLSGDMQGSLIQKKRRDLSQRVAIAEEVDADLYLSIHTNADPSPRWYGAQTFYYANSPQSKVLANCIQDEMVRILGNNKRKAKEGVFYIMEKTTMPTVIIEVGFISNPREERMLMDELYQTRIAYAIMSGLVKYSGKEAIP
ncbi:MAG: N-acetylmuramoyl-L-alanine amidase CwlD [Syntrophomonadales bacterium]